MERNLNDITGRIYVLKDPRTGEVKYVGKTIQSLEKRLGEHIRHSKAYSHKTANWIKKLEANNMKPSIETIEEPSVSSLDDREIFYIKKFRDEGINLLNHTNGGEGTAGLEWSEESRIQKSIAMSAEVRGGSKLSEEDIIEIYKLFREGISNQNIAEKYGVTRQYVNRIRNGEFWSHIYPWDDPFEAADRTSKIGLGSYLTDEQVKSIHEKLKSGEYQSDLSKEYGVSPASISQINVDKYRPSLGLGSVESEKKPKRSNSKESLERLEKENVMDIYELIRNGKSNVEISKIYNVSQSYISMIRSGKRFTELYPKDNPLPKTDYSGARRSRENGKGKLTEEQVLEIHSLIREGNSDAAISRMYETSDTAIRNIRNNRTWKYLYPKEGFGPTKNVRSALLSEDQVVEIHNLLAKKVPNGVIAEKFGVSAPLISQIKTGKRWIHLHPDNTN